MSALAQTAGVRFLAWHPGILAPLMYQGFAAFYGNLRDLSSDRNADRGWKPLLRCVRECPLRDTDCRFRQSLATDCSQPGAGFGDAMQISATKRRSGILPRLRLEAAPAAWRVTGRIGACAVRHHTEETCNSVRCGVGIGRRNNAIRFLLSMLIAVNRPCSLIAMTLRLSTALCKLDLAPA